MAGASPPTKPLYLELVTEMSGSTPGQAFRVRKICDSEEICKESLKDLSGDFIRRGFKRKFVESQFLKARKKSRETLLR